MAETTFQADAATITIEEFDKLRGVSWTGVSCRSRARANDRAAVISPHLPLRPIFGIARLSRTRCAKKDPWQGMTTQGSLILGRVS
jgi:hypothetical protein